MKKLLVILLLVMPIIFVSCSKDDDDISGGGDNGKTYCWTFTTTQVTSVSGASVPGYPETIKTETEQCGLTEKQAEEVCKRATSTTSSNVGGVKVTIKTTTTKRKK